MDRLRYAHFVFTRYLPLIISSWATAYFVYYLFIDTSSSLEDFRYMCLCALVSTAVGWLVVFVTEERLRKLIFASVCLVDSISKVIEESKSEDRN